MRDALETFKKQTGYDIQSYFESFALFCNSYYPLIVAYYTGQDDVNIGDSFGRLDTLMKQSQEIEPLFTLKATGLSRIDSWELLDMFTECQTKLWTIDNSSRWLRSAIIGRYGMNVALQRVLKTRETFENVSSQLGSNNPQDDWVDIARNNAVEEEDYDANTGGGMFKINIRTSGNFISRILWIILIPKRYSVRTSTRTFGLKTMTWRRLNTRLLSDRLWTQSFML